MLHYQQSAQHYRTLVYKSFKRKCRMLWTKYKGKYLDPRNTKVTGWTKLQSDELCNFCSHLTLFRWLISPRMTICYTNTSYLLASWVSYQTFEEELLHIILTVWHVQYLHTASFLQFHYKHFLHFSQFLHICYLSISPFLM